MKLKLLFVLICTFSTCLTFSNEPILVTETTIVLNFNESKEIFFSFAEGDEIIFDMKMIRGKHIKEIEVLEMPFNSLLTEFKSRSFNDKRLQIKNKGVYKFRFFSSSLTRRVCKIIIKRIPKNESSKSFNTNWKWKTMRDTIYTPYQVDSLTGYQTIKYKETIRELKSTNIEEIMLFEKSQKVHSYYNENRSKTYLKVDLPQLTKSEFIEENLIAWSYWIGVEQEGRKAYNKNLKSVSKLVSNVGTKYYPSPLAAIAVGAITKLITPQTGEDVEYYFIRDFANTQLFLNGQRFRLFDQGKGTAAYGRNDQIKAGIFYIGLSNDNKFLGIEVDVKVLALKEVKKFENVTYDREKQEPQFVTLNKTRMNINETRIRVPVE
ncbi:MAG: hypothetical protein ACPG44_04750 [Polaribacter sp.]